MKPSKPADQRKSVRRSVRIHNGARILTHEGDCIADIIDVSEEGIGLGYYDFFCAMDLSRGARVKLRIALDLDADILSESHGEVSHREGGGANDERDLLDIDAVVAWSYLNRIGLIFKNGPEPAVMKALLEYKSSRGGG